MLQELDRILIDGSIEVAEGRVATPSSVQSLNRKQRRKAGQRSEVNIWQGRLDQMATDMNRTNDQWREVGKLNKMDLTRIIYQGEPVINPYLETRYRLARFLGEAHFANLTLHFATPQHLNQFDKEDVFLRPINGTNLLEVAEMLLPLSIEDIRRINEMFYMPVRHILLPNVFKEKKEDGKLHQTMFLLATHKVARPEEKIPISSSLQPIYSRFKNYFDYYTQLMTDFSLGDLEDSEFLRILARGKPWLLQALGCYIPGRLGLTPSSTIKLFYEKAHHSYLPEFLWGTDNSLSHPLGLLSFGAREAIRPKALPSDLRNYAYFNLYNDKKASRTLLNYVESQNSNTNQAIDIHQKTDAELLRLASIRGELRRDILNSPDGRLDFVLDTSSPIRRVTLATQYRQTLMFILHIYDGSHLLLEYAQNEPKTIDKDDHLYGWPMELIKHGPHLDRIILADVLEAVLKQTKIVEISQAKQIKEEAPEESIDQKEERIYIPRPKDGKPKFRPKILTPIAQILSSPKPHPLQEHIGRRFVVIHSRSMIKGFVGKNIPEDVIDRLMCDIRDFEFGRVGINKKLEGGDLWELRVGKYRIVLQHQKRKFYSLVDVGDRKDIFKRERLAASNLS